jgi:hypothetical protein
MKDFDCRRPYTSEALIAALEAANLPALPDNLRRMIAEGSPLLKMILDALLAELENPGGDRSPVDELPDEVRAIAQRLRGDVSLINACTLEEAKRAQIETWKLAELQRKIAGNVLH